MTSDVGCRVACAIPSQDPEDRFSAVNAIYARYFRNNPPARIFVCVAAWPGGFDIEVDCMAAI
jgi:enamine deaminase RidA (YjgF/YER057c/UK114 family)